MRPNIITPIKLPLHKVAAQNRENKNIQRKQEGIINGNKDETKESRRQQDVQDEQNEDYDDEEDEDEYVDEDEMSNDGKVYESDFYGENQDKEYISRKLIH